jgi:hypothetical protein
MDTFLRLCNIRTRYIVIAFKHLRLEESLIAFFIENSFFFSYSHVVVMHGVLVSSAVYRGFDILDWGKPKTIKLVVVASSISPWDWKRKNKYWFTWNQDNVSDCCVRITKVPQSVFVYYYKQTRSLSHQNVICSGYDIAELIVHPITIDVGR